MSNPKDLVGAKKAPLGLVPPALEIGAAEAMADGAVKYGPFNWRDQPVEYMTYLVAMKRHIDALIDGEDFAADSGYHHLHHIAAGTGILIDANNIPGCLIDNRPPKGPASKMLAEQDKSVKPTVTRKGSNFPKGPEEGQEFTRTDLGDADFVFDGTVWVSVQISRPPQDESVKPSIPAEEIRAKFFQYREGTGEPVASDNELPSYDYSRWEDGRCWRCGRLQGIVQEWGHAIECSLYGQDQRDE